MDSVARLPYPHLILSVLTAIDACEILLAHEVCFVTDGGVLGDATVEPSRSARLPNELDPEPSIAIRFKLRQRFGDDQHPPARRCQRGR